jgi:hypothetical protein
MNTSPSPRTSKPFTDKATRCPPTQSARGWRTLRRQHDHAADHDQTHRAALFHRLLTDLEQKAS